MALELNKYITEVTVTKNGKVETHDYSKQNLSKVSITVLNPKNTKSMEIMKLLNLTKKAMHFRLRKNRRSLSPIMRSPDFTFILQVLQTAQIP